MKSTKGYWIGGGLIVLGAILAVLWLVISVVRLDDQIDEFERVPFGDAQPVRLEARKYIVYFEGFDTGGNIPTAEVVTIADAESMAVVEIEPYDGSLTYSFGDREGTAQGTVTPSRAGDYLVAAGIDGNVSNAAVALGDSIAGSLLRTIVGTFAIGGLMVGGGVVLLVVTAIRLNRGRSTA